MQLMCSRGDRDLRRLNPFLSDADVVRTRALTVGAIVRTSRLQQLGRCIVRVRKLIKTMERVRATPELSRGLDSPIAQELRLQVGAGQMLKAPLNQSALPHQFWGLWRSASDM